MTTGETHPPPPKIGAPDAEVDIDAELVSELISEQAPAYAGLELQLLANGWDNCTLRLGNELAVRVPRRTVAALLIENEQRFLSEIASWVDLPVPAPVFKGRPSERFAWPWSIVPFFEGTTTAEQPLAPSQAPLLAHFLRQLHRPDDGDAPPNPYRGVPLRERRDSLLERLSRLKQLDVESCRGLDFQAIGELFDQACQAPLAQDRVWLHGDLHPKNVLSLDGELAAILDWGDLTAGDRATDLGALYMHFEPEVYQDFLQAYFESPESASSLATKERARGWATMMGVILLDSGIVNDQVFERIGRQILERVLRSAT